MLSSQCDPLLWSKDVTEICLCNQLHNSLKNTNFIHSVDDHGFIDEEKIPEAKYDIMSYVYSSINDTEDLVNVGLSLEHWSNKKHLQMMKFRVNMF